MFFTSHIISLFLIYRTVIDHSSVLIWPYVYAIQHQCDGALQPIPMTIELELEIEIGTVVNDSNVSSTISVVDDENDVVRKYHYWHFLYGFRFFCLLVRS